MKIAIAAAAGNVGSRIARQLQHNPDIELILLGNNLSSLKNLKIDNAKLISTDISDILQVEKATKDVNALFWMVPPVLNTLSLKNWYERVTKAGINAVKNNSIERVVLLSCLGAGSKENLGTVTYSGYMEQDFDKLNTNILALRPGYFMENLLLQQSSILNKGYFSFTYSGSHRIPFISTDDIGDAASHYLSYNEWSGKWKLNLMGPENITPFEIANRISKVLNKNIKYTQISISEVDEDLKNSGINSVVIDELKELFIALGDPQGVYNTPRTYEAQTNTSLEEFIKLKLC